MSLVSRTRANFRKAELGFFGVIVPTFTATPRLRGEEKWMGLLRKLLKPNDKAGALVFAPAFFLGFFNNWPNVGKVINSKCKSQNEKL
jgi:hypothetical protein